MAERVCVHVWKLVLVIHSASLCVLVGAVFYGTSLSFLSPSLSFSFSIFSLGFIRGSVRPGLLPLQSPAARCHGAFTPPPIKVSERWHGLSVLSGPEQRAPGRAHVPARTQASRNVRLSTVCRFICRVFWSTRRV